MNNLAVVGGQFGDECKAAVVNRLMPWFHVGVRFNGSGNAGHTVFIKDKKFVLHYIPVSYLHGKSSFIGRGCVIDVYELIKEKNNLDQAMKDAGLALGKLYVDENCMIIEKVHKEAEAQVNHIGTTNRGVGPCYAAKVARLGKTIKEWAYGNTVVFPFSIMNVGDELHYLNEGSRILFEGAQGSMLDINYGSYPYVTSSTTLASGIPDGSGLRVRDFGKVLSVYKPYITRVGNGPFPSELKEDLDDEHRAMSLKIRDEGHEYGSTTGRPRRIGAWCNYTFQYDLNLNRPDFTFFAKLDVIRNLNTWPFVRDYPNPIPYLGRAPFQLENPNIEILPFKKALQHLQSMVNYSGCSFGTGASDWEIEDDLKAYLGKKVHS